MDLYFFTESRFFKSKGIVYSLESSMNNQLWQRYLKEFDNIHVVARIKQVDYQSFEQNKISSCEHVFFHSIGYYVGVSQFLKTRIDVIKNLKEVIDSAPKDSACICRLPGMVGGLAISYLKKTRKQYACEVVGDPWDVYSPGSKVGGVFRPFLRLYSTMKLKLNVKEACAVLYVTENKLQLRYPVKKGAFSTHASNVNLNESIISKSAKKMLKSETVELVSVGSLEQLYKSPDVVIKALYILKKRDINVHVNWLGDGRCRSSLEQLSQKLDVSNNISFRGNLPSEEVFKYYNSSNLFILVSRTEGLPRAMIEAMSQGLPCIGTNVGGIPELINPSCLVPKNSPVALANKIEYMINNLDFSNKNAEYNLSRSLNFSNDVLSRKRNAFYRYIKDKSV